jgi:ribosome maturation factor RimP
LAGEEVVMNGGSRHAEPRQERLAELLGPVVSAVGLELESVRVGRAGSRRVLRVVVDGDHGVDMDDVARVSRAVAAEVDGRDAMGSAPYTLEVSSPGVDRPLTEPRHWRRATGRLVQVSVKDFSSQTADAGPTGNAERTVEGRIVATGEAGVTLEIGGERRDLGYADLGPGRVQVEFGGRYGDLGGPADGDNLAGGEPDGH